jgi:hypothetical protein
MAANLDDCGYRSAVSVLLDVGNTMKQKTPTAVARSTDWERRAREISTRNKKRVRPMDRVAESELEEASRPLKRARKLSSPELLGEKAHQPVSAASAPTEDLEQKMEWDSAQKTEQLSPFHVLPNYPDFKTFLPPGARRRCVNVIHLMASALNLEICTPGLGVLIMDRFLSSRRTLPSRTESVMLTAMICLNAAGKVADVDKGFCGSHGVMAMVRDATPFSIRQPDHPSFAKYVAAIEREVMRGVDGTLLSCPCAMQIIANVTNWNETDEPMWLRAAIMCDVFGTDSASTRYMQTQIARSVVNVLTEFSGTASRPLGHCVHAAEASILQSIQTFVNSASERDMWKDPYFGVRRRHSENSEMSYFLARWKSF